MTNGALLGRLTGNRGFQATLTTGRIAGVVPAGSDYVRASNEGKSGPLLRVMAFVLTAA